MERNEFLRLLGTAGIAVCAGCSLESCSSSSDPAPSGNPGPSGIDFTLDLTAPANTALNSDGGFVYNSGVIVVCLSASLKVYTAVSQACTHQGTTIGFDAANGNFLCPAHGSRFSTNGAVVNGPAATSLRKFNTSLTGTNLRVFA
ncbi:MAG: Rieske 2Fe-2S domain-containing protein [Cyclobacteriaceae bacterium]|nr:Rieske 2Fe-2S domain-containing protein [Cyclobacteriaceae bacterium]